MPALFAYLVAVCVLLSGGYGALNWVSQPEPVKVVAKAHPKPKPSLSYEAEAAISSSALGENANDVREFNPQSGGAVDAPGRLEIEIAGPSPKGSANAEVQEVGGKQPVPAGSSSNVGTVGASAPVSIAKPGKQSVSKQARKRPEKRALALMTLRTIEFPDGRRTTQLIPYRGSDRALAFQLGD